MLFRNQKNYKNDNKNNSLAEQHDVGLTANILELDAVSMELIGGGGGEVSYPIRIGG